MRMTKKEVVLGVRNLLAERGTELTVEEAEGIVAQVEVLYDTVDSSVYEGFALMTPGKLFLAAHTEKVSVKKMIEIRDLIMYTYERKIGMTEAAWEHPLAEPKPGIDYHEADDYFDDDDFPG
jgi:hypothetical protein